MKLGNDIFSKNVLNHQDQSNVENNPTVLCEAFSFVDAEQIKILEGFNNTTKEDDKSCTSIIEMFKEQVSRVPNHIAVVYEEKQYTYQELDKITDKLAKKLKALGVGAEQAVGILIDRSEYMVIYPLAVLKAGGAYMPLDYSFPTDRLEFMIQDAGVAVILSEGNKVAEHIPNFSGRVINIQELSNIEVDESITLSMPGTHDMFVILYTSGSTGMPKGCILEHYNLVNYCNWHQSYYSVTEDDRAAAYANFGFDAHMLDIYPYITCGASTYIIPAAMRMDFITLNQYFEENQLSIAFMTTQLGRQFVEEFANKSLRALTIGGEKLLPIKKPAYDFYNAYGPTECTLFTTIYQINSDYDSAIIGSPLDNYQLYVLDSNLQLLPIGASGELCIAGAGVGRGYLNREDVTNEKFVMWNGKRIYRTGDMVRWTNEGDIEYVGRIDGQVKLRGLRIELGEIESQMLSYEGIISAAVAVKEISGVEHLCAYYTAQSEIDVEELVGQMATKLAAFMIPTSFTKLDKLPLTSNGKVNKKALPDPVIERQDFVPPQNATEQQLFDLIATILDTTNFGVTDDLFSMGLTSILAIKVSVGIYKQFNNNVKTNDIFKHKTIEKLAILINTAEKTAVETFEKRDYYPLTENQLGLYYEWEKDREALQYNLPEILKFSKKVNPNQLKAAAVAVVEAHPYLKSCLGKRDGQVVQLRKDSELLEIELKTVKQAEIQHIKDAFTQPFDLFTGPLCRIVIYATEEYTYLFMDIHHIIVDGSALGVFTNDLVAAYQGGDLTPESYTAFEYALESEALVGTEGYLAAEKFFDQKLEEGMTALSQGVQGGENGKAKIVITYVRDEKIEKFCKDNAVTPSNLFLSALSTTLHRYTREERIAITTISSGRNENKLHGIMGMFVKTLPIVITIQPSEKVVDFVKLVQENMFETMENEIYPFTKMVEKHHCVPQITYVYQGGMLEGFELEGQTVEIESLPLQKAKFPLTVSVSPKNEGYEISIEYDDRLYTEDYIKILSLAVTQCATHMVENSGQSCKNVVIISKEEQDKILNEFQGAVLAYDQSATFIDLFKKQVAENPEAIAVVDNKSRITYQETNRYSDCIAQELVRLGVKENNFVGIMLPRCKEFMVGVIGIMKAGGAYLPLDNEYPQERIAYMIEDSQASVLITQKNIYQEKGIHVANVIFIDEFDFNVDRNQEIQSKAPTTENMAYMIYTSGSTGKPKGVMIRHKSLAAFLAWRGKDYQLTEKDHISCHSSFSFDASVYDLFVPLVLGGELHIISEEMRQDMQGLYQYIHKNYITDGTFSTQFGMELINQFDLSLKSITLGGEKFKPVKKTDTMLVNGYGPTEFTICSSYHVIDQDAYCENIPIGKPVANSWSYIVDGNNNLMPIGIAGELCLAGAQIALGYWRREDLTQEKFIDNPFMTCAENAKMYRTGDLVAWNQAGELEYVGRIDNQIKLRGFRIELGEIESAMTKFPEITASVADIKEIGKAQHLCGYFTGNIEIDKQQLREYLSQSLTEYMVPTVLMQLDKIPLTPNGKVDKKALPNLVIERQERVAPQNEREQQLFDLVAKMLEIEDFGIRDDLFTMGMTSILAIKLSVSIYNQFNINIKTSEIFKNKTIETLAVIIKNTEPAEVVETFAKREYYPVTENQLGLYYEWEKDRTALQYNIPEVFKFPSEVNPHQLKDALINVIEAHPYLKTYLGTMGGQIVQLRKDDQPVHIEIHKVNLEEIQNIKETFVQPFDLFNGPLYKMAIYYTEQYTYLFINIHHIIIDGSALGVFLENLVKAYQGEKLIPESYTAFEYAVEEAEGVGSEAYLAAEKFFDDKLEDSMTVLAAGGKGEGEGKSKIIINHVYNPKIETFCNENGVTPSNLFLSALCTVVHRYTREERIGVTVVSSGRDQNKLHDIMGMFVKTLPIIVPIQPSSKIVDFVKKVQENMFETMEHEIYPFTKMAEKHKIVPQINYAYQGGMLEGIEVGGHPVELEGLALDKAKFPVSVAVSPGNDKYEILIEYDDSLYTKEYIETVSSAIGQCVTYMVENPGESCKKIGIISKEEQEKVLKTFQGKELAYDQEATFVDLFQKQVAENPEAIAIVDYKSSFTYQQTHEYSDCIAKELVRLGVKENNFVGVMLPRCNEFMVSVIGIMKAGGAYLPLDNEYPQERIAYMLEDSEARVLITQRDIYKEKGIQVEHVIFVDEFDFNVESNQGIQLQTPSIENVAYMIYTSGSTGKPKGVMIRHKSLVGFLAWRIKDYHLTADSRLSCHSSFSFDASVYDLFAPLVIGGQLHIISEKMRQDMQGLHEYIQEHHITDALFSTQFGMELINQFDMSIKSITLGGEKLKPVKKIGAMLVNAYGPTEFTIASSYHVVDQDTYCENIPIGKPVANSWSYIVDGNNNLMPIGVAGELCLAGVQIALGYWKREDLTKEKFVDNPFKTCPENAKMYRTGDLVAWNQAGELEYVGRIDNQIKLRGFRIELGEIESAMTKFPGVTASVAEIKTIGNVQHLCGYFTGNVEIDKQQLREQLSQSLTEYMVPTAFMQLDKIPLTPNGKVDKKALPALEIKSNNEYVPPTNELEEKLCTIFAETLQLDQVGITDSFFELGGTSLLVMKVVVKAMAMDIGLTYANVFKYQKPQELATFLMNTVEETVTNDISGYDYRAIDQLLQKNTLGEITLTPIGDILLTGATGFLGIHVLKDFLEHYPGKVYCLMRSKDGKSADARLKVRLAYYFEKDYDELFGKRIFTIEGDMNQLVTSNVAVDTVINCAAIVKHFAAGDELEKVNVVGVQKLIDYCLAHDAMLIQVSTTSVSGTGGDAIKDVKITETQLYLGQTLDNKYTHSKYLAERYVLAAIEKGLKAKIMRVGNLMSRNTDGEFQINFQGNSFMSSLKAYRLLGKFPVSYMGGEVEFSPIDSTAKAILKLAQSNGEYTVFHPYNNHAIYLSDIIYVMKEYGFNIDIVSDSEFAECLREKMQDDNMISALTGILAYEENNTGKPIYALGRSNQFTTEVLYRLQFKWPMTSEVYIKKAIEALDGLGFFDE